ncbi:hypothetical protein HZP66_05395 [Elizabethkingia anophelis]|nr:hypothetical protein [Elizabethkingia anophelis]
MDPFTMLMASNVLSGTGSSGASNVSQSSDQAGTGMSNLASNFLDGILGGIMKQIGCLGKQAFDTTRLQEGRDALDRQVGYLGSASYEFASSLINECTFVENAFPPVINILSNACSKENANLLKQYVTTVKTRILERFEVQDAGIGNYVKKSLFMDDPKFPASLSIPLVRVVGVKNTGISSGTDLPINGGVGQNEYNPVQSAITYTQDEVNQMIKNASLTNNLSSSDLGSLLQLKTQLQNNPNCRGGFKDGKPYLDCSVTNDHTQNMIQVAGLALTAVGLIYMMTKKKK